MKQLLRWFVLIAALTVLTAAACLAEDGRPEEPEEPAEWTVLFYICGADLETKYGYASMNLADIAGIVYPYDFRPVYEQETYTRKDMMREIGKVNILIETGGSRKWHAAEKPGIEVSADMLQRWRYEYYPDADGTRPAEPFRLMESLPPQSMADPETLADFIRWGAETCPAKKTALVIWGHGSGARTGLLIDERFGNDTMYLYELRQALADGGVYLEALVIDACMMANIETAWNVKDSAHWMIASEETVPGEGSAIGEWMQALVNHPALDGKWLGRTVCDLTESRYGRTEERDAEKLLTWSVTDLTKIDRLIASLGNLVQQLNDVIAGTPDIASFYVIYLAGAERYGENRQDMYDLGSVIYAETISNTVDPPLLDEAAEALAEAVVYVSRGPEHNGSRGLTFCYPAGADSQALTLYARNFPMPRYLAYLDSISSWEAPEWVYAETERLPDIDTIEALQVTVEKMTGGSGIPGICFGGTRGNLNEVSAVLYRRDEDSGDILRLGKTESMAEVTQDDVIQRIEDPTRWLAVDGQLCSAELSGYSGEDTLLYNIPVQINTDIAILRLGKTVTGRVGDTRTSRYEIYGVWEGFSTSGELPDRSVESLAMVAGSEYRPVYPVYGTEGDARYYHLGRREIMPKALEVTEIPLPPGTYYLEYEITDLFMRTRTLERIEYRWDGEKISFPEGFRWEGKEEIRWKQ